MAELDDSPPRVLMELFDCLKRNKQDEALGLIASMDVSTLNLLVEVTDNCFITALQCAVPLNQPRIVNALLEKRVDVNKGEGCYSNFYGYFIWKSTPLLSALIKSNFTLIDILLEHGADPLFDSDKAKQLNPMNGRQHGSAPISIPFSFALSRGNYIFSRFLQYTDVSAEFGPGNHTCLCYALRHYLDECCSSASLHYMQRIIQKGGRVCSGDSNNFAEEWGIVSTKGICSEIVHCLNVMLNEREETLHGFHCTNAKAAHNCLSLVCATDYVHENSSLYKTLATYTDAIKTNNIRVALDELAEVDVKRFEQKRQILTWMTTITKQPSNLKHICRVYVRSLIPNMCIEAIQALPLPTELIDYVNVVNKV